MRRDLTDKNKIIMIIGVLITITFAILTFYTISFQFWQGYSRYYITNFIIGLSLFFSLTMYIGIAIAGYGNKKWKQNKLYEIKNVELKKKIKNWKKEGYDVNELESMIENIKR